MTETVGNRLALLRRRARLTAKDLGTVAGLSTSIVALIESDERQGTNFSTLRKLSAVLGASVAYLADGEGKPPSNRVLARAVARAVERKNLELSRESKRPVEFLRSA